MPYNLEENEIFIIYIILELQKIKYFISLSKCKVYVT